MKAIKDFDTIEDYNTYLLYYYAGQSLAGLRAAGLVTRTGIGPLGSSVDVWSSLAIAKQCISDAKALILELSS